MNSHDEPRAVTPFGVWCGERRSGLNVFRGVRYARPPVGALRFRLPEDLPISDAEHDATADGPIPPQAPSRIEFAMGPFSKPQSEDCLTLTIWAPADLGNEKVPVIVFFHGGAFSTGAGSLQWYSGEPLARLGRVVVVTVNSRLGVLGYLRLKGVSPGNLGLHDQLASLRWIQRSIAGFGGDPDRVTIMGQSAGAYAVVALTLHKGARSLFTRAIVQSAPLAKPPQTEQEAETRGLALTEAIGIAPRLEGLQECSVQKLFQAAAKVAPRFLSPSTECPLPPYLPCLDGDLISEPLLSGAARGDAAWCDMIVGCTRDESTVFARFDPRIADLSQEQLREVLKATFGPRADAILAEYTGLRGWRDSATLIHDVLADTQFIAPSVELALCQARAGRRAFVYQFDWQSPQTDLGATHCLELPFLLGEADAWSQSPMFRGVNPRDYSHISNTMRRHWTAFAKNGVPATPEGPPWPAYDEADRITMRFDRHITPINDLAGSRWRTVFSPSANSRVN